MLMGVCLDQLNTEFHVSSNCINNNNLQVFQLIASYLLGVS